MTESAPATNRPRRYRSPCLLILPSLCLPPLECCCGTIPIQAEKLRPDRKDFGSATVATTAVARSFSGATTRRLRYRPDMATASGRTSGHSDASIAGEQLPGRRHQRRRPGKLTWRCLNRLSLSSAWLAPPNRGSLNSAHIHGTHVPAEEPSTASKAEVRNLIRPYQRGRSTPAEVRD